MDQGTLPVRTVLFVEQSNHGELARRVRVLLRELQPMLGFGVKVVERTGTTLKGKFPLNTLWEGAPCGRLDCVTCTQGGEVLPPCTRRNLVYESICALCNPGVRGKEEIKEVKEHSLYVGESARSISERGKEHMAKLRKEAEDSHMWKHMVLHHAPGEEPDFVLKPVQYHKSALRRQLGEAVRIRRRGGGGCCTE